MGLFDALKEKEEDKSPFNTVEMYRRVFATPAGRLVLGHMLASFGIFNELQCTEEEVALHNAGVRLLYNLGVINAENFQSLVDALMNVNIKRGF